MLNTQKEVHMSVLNNFNGLSLLLIMALSYLAVLKNTSGDEELFKKQIRKWKLVCDNSWNENALYRYGQRPSWFSIWHQ